jgi:peptide/nickel transport system substrate-binding protein
MAKRQAIYARMWPELRKDLPVSYLWTPRNIVAMTAKLQGFHAVPDGMIRLQGVDMGK